MIIVACQMIIVYFGHQVDGRLHIHCLGPWDANSSKYLSGDLLLIYLREAQCLGPLFKNWEVLFIWHFETKSFP